MEAVARLSCGHGGSYERICNSHCPSDVVPAQGRIYLIDVDASEPFAANCLPVGNAIIYPVAFPATGAILSARGYQLKLVVVDELAKAEGAVTCCSLILEN